MEAKETQLKAAEHRLSVLLSSTKEGGSTQAMTQGADNEQLKAAMADIATLQEKLAASQKDAEQYRAISAGVEEAMKDLSKNSDDYKKFSEERVSHGASFRRLPGLTWLW